MYILTDTARKKLFIGSTTELFARVYEHKVYDFKNPCKILVYFKRYSSYEKAMEVEEIMKATAAIEHIYLIEEQNPEWRDLFVISEN